MSWHYNQEHPQCDVCGRFVSFTDIDAGKAVGAHTIEPYETMDGPDFHEGYDCLCPKHKKEAPHD